MFKKALFPGKYIQGPVRFLVSGMGDEPAHIVVFYAGTADLPITQTQK